MAGPPEQKGGRSEASKGRLKAILFLGGAVAAALVTALLLTRYMDARVAAVRVPTEKVVVAQTDLTIATTLREDLLAVVDWPVASKPDGTFADPKQLEGKVINVSVGKREPVLASKLATGEGKSALSTVLERGMRAVSVRVDDVVGVAGFIHPGDHVDVIVTMQPNTGGAQPISKVVLQNIKVLAVGKELESRGRDLQKALPATVATLMVDADDSERLALSASKGQILLALRSGIDDDLVTTSGIGPLALLGRQEPRAEPKAEPEKKKTKPARKPVAKVQVVPPVRETKSVEILRGDMYEKRDFHKDGN